MSETERLFVGVPIDEATRFALMRQLPRNLPGKQPPPENWHLTLRFLGSTDASQRDKIIERLASTRFGPPFDLSFDRLGAFPGSRRAQVLWIGASAGHDRLESVARKVEEISTSVGFDAENRPFRAHLTISRMREPSSVAAILSKARPIQVTMRVEEIDLYRSESGGPHSRYSVVTASPLA
jgi:2'-5' RNA ligase